MSDNDLIRRGDVLDAMCKGPRTVQERIDAIRAIAAIQPDPRRALMDQILRDAMASGLGITVDGKRVAPEDFFSPIPQPDPRDEVIAKLMEALRNIRDFIVEPSGTDNVASLRHDLRFVHSRATKTLAAAKAAIK